MITIQWAEWFVQPTERGQTNPIQDLRMPLDPSFESGQDFTKAEKPGEGIVRRERP